MTSGMRELYQEVILDHSKRPRNFRAMADATHTATGNNPLCGDRVEVYVRLDGGRIADASFVGQGCAISRASASMMTEALRGRTTEEAHALFTKFHGMVTGDSGNAPDGPVFGKLSAFAGVSEFPVRVKCASLPWHTLEAALVRSKETVTTEA